MTVDGACCKFILALLLPACWCPSAIALNPSLDIGQYAHTAWKIRDGFPNGYVQALAQTPDGYLWLGTEFGLIRFDGLRHVSWQPPLGQRLPSNEIRGLLAGRDGSLWIGTRMGLARWGDGKLTVYAEFAGHDVYKILEGRDGTIWVGGIASSKGSLCAIRSATVECHGTDGSFGEAVVALYEDGARDLWFGASTGLWRWTPAGPTHYSMSGFESPVRAVLDDESGGLLLGAQRGLLQWTNGTARAGPMALRDVPVRHLLRDRDGAVWIATTNGVLHMRGARVDSYTQSQGLSGDKVTALFEDREGSIWVASLDGLDRFRDFAIPTISTAQGLPGRPLSVMATGSDIWIATLGGLSRWRDGEITNYRRNRDRPATNGVSHLRRDAGSSVRAVFDHALPGDQIHSLAKGQTARVWVSTNNGVAYFQDAGFVALPGVSGGVFHSIAADLTGSVWISHQTEGLIHVRHESVVERIPWNSLGPGGVATSLLADGVHGGLWLGFTHGGVRYFKDGKVIASYERRDGLGGGLVASFHLDGDGTLWAATQGGLSRLRNGSVTTLTRSNGLPCDVVHWASEDDMQSFWLGTACGVVRIARREMDAWVSDSKRRIEMTVFDGADGFRSQAVPSTYTPLVAKSREGHLWFVTFDGVGVIDPRQLAFNKRPPPVHVEQIVADRKTYDVSSQVRLPPLVRDLQIDYTALSLVIPEKNRFRYRLEGRDSDWQDAGNRRQAFYTDLDPGTYRFRVIACNNSGVWNEEGASLDFSVAPAYWQTNWFRALCVLSFMALLWALYLLRVRHLRSQFNMTLDARVGERTRIARELHDTLLQSFQGLLLRFQTVYEMLPGRPAAAKETLGSAIDQTAQAITEGRHAVQGLRASTVETNDLALALTSLGEELAAEASGGMAAHVSIAIEGASRALRPIVRDEAYRIAAEALRNAFRHAGAKEIEVELRYDPRQFRFRIRDDGKGIAQEYLTAEGREGHFGLHGMRERAKLIGGKFTVWTAPDSGTEIELTISAGHAYTEAASGRSWLAEKLSRMGSQSGGGG